MNKRDKRKEKYVINFMCYCPRIYSGLDKYMEKMAEELLKKNYKPVFVYTDTLENVPIIQTELEKRHAIVEIIPSKGFLKLLLSYIKLFVKYHPVVVHTHFMTNMKILSTIFCSIFQCKSYVHFGSMIMKYDTIEEYKNIKGRMKTFLLKMYFLFLSKGNTNIIAISRCIERQLLEFVPNMHNSKTIYLGECIDSVKENKSVLRKEFKLPQELIVFGNVSAIEELKGLDVAIEALYILVSKYKFKDFRFCHVGGFRNDNIEAKNYYESLKIKISEYKLEKYVIWFGYQKEVERILATFDFYIHPSRLEGLGFVNIEAAIQKKPIIATNVGGIPEVVFPNKNGFLIDVNDSEALAYHILKLSKEPRLRDDMGEASYGVVKRNFEVGNQVDKIIDLYKID